MATKRTDLHNAPTVSPKGAPKVTSAREIEPSFSQGLQDDDADMCVRPTLVAADPLVFNQLAKEDALPSTSRPNRSDRETPVIQANLRSYDTEETDGPQTVRVSVEDMKPSLAALLADYEGNRDSMRIEPPPSGVLSEINAQGTGLRFDSLPPHEESFNDALELVSQSTTRRNSISVAFNSPEPTLDPLADVRHKFALNDFSGALAGAEEVLSNDAHHHEALRIAESCRESLKKMYVARLGSLARIPTTVIGADKLRWLTLDHRAGFLLSHIDGYSTIEEILDISGMALLDALRILAQLVEQKVITLR